MDRSGERLAVVGVGGIGGLVAGLLAREGNDVVCIARPESAALLEEGGLEVRSPHFGDFTVSVDAVPALAEPVAACFVAVKAPDLAGALERVPAAVLGDAPLVPFLNGVEHVALLREAYPEAAVIAAVIRVQSARVGVGEIEHASPFALVELARRRPGDSEAEALAERLAAACLDVKLRDSEVDMLWDKLSFLAPLALMTTHTGQPAGVVREQDRDELLAVIGEVASVARAEGAQVEAAAVIEFFDSVPPTMESSMQLDAAAGRPTELDAIGGAVLRAAERSGIEVPATRRLVDALATPPAAN